MRYKVPETNWKLPRFHPRRMPNVPSSQTISQSSWKKLMFWTFKTTRSARANSRRKIELKIMFSGTKLIKISMTTFSTFHEVVGKEKGATKNSSQEFAVSRRLESMHQPVRLLQLTQLELLAPNSSWEDFWRCEVWGDLIVKVGLNWRLTIISPRSCFICWQTFLRRREHKVSTSEFIKEFLQTITMQRMSRDSVPAEEEVACGHANDHATASKRMEELPPQRGCPAPDCPRCRWAVATRPGYFVKEQYWFERILV